jgi:D-alanine-D-alanine ligase
MDRKLRIGVIFGGRSGEHEVSLMSANSVLAALDPEKYQVTQIGITLDGAWVVSELAHGGNSGVYLLEDMLSGDLSGLASAALLPDPTHARLYSVRGNLLEVLAELDVIFPVLHGTFGEDGTLQGVLEMADIAYVGAGVLGSSVGMDKALFKDVMRAHNLPVLESVLLLRSEIEGDLDAALAKAEAAAPYPLFVKPANLGSSVGVSKCRSRSDLMEGLMDAARFDRRVLVERGVQAREIEVSVLGNDNPVVSLPGEILPAEEFYSYNAKYHDDRSRLLIPAPLPGETTAQVQEIALQAYKAIDCAGMARVDYLLDKDSGNLYLSEVNTIPGFTNISMYAKLWEASGMSYTALVDRLVELALERKQDRDRTQRRYER